MQLQYTILLTFSHFSLCIIKEKEPRMSDSEMFSDSTTNDADFTASVPDQQAPSSSRSSSCSNVAASNIKVDKFLQSQKQKNKTIIKRRQSKLKTVSQQKAKKGCKQQQEQVVVVTLDDEDGNEDGNEDGTEDGNEDDSEDEDEDLDGDEESCGRGVRGSLAWEFYRRISPTHAQCNLCSKRVKAATGSTSGLRAHLRNKHKDKYEKMQSTEENQKTEPTPKQKRTRVRQQKLKNYQKQTGATFTETWEHKNPKTRARWESANEAVSISSYNYIGHGTIITVI